MLTIAIDHGASFNRLMREWNVDRASDHALRIRIGQCVASSGVVDALIYSQSVLSSLGRDTLDIGALWLGLQDYGIKAFPDGLTMSADTVRDWNGGQPITAIKVGVDGLADVEVPIFERAADAIASVQTSLPDTLIVIEPYFDVEDEVSMRVAAINALAESCPRAYFKVDYSNGNGQWLANLRKQLSRRWALRSAGMSFSSYLDALRDAMTYGCDGAIVGAAVWSDLGGGLWRGEVEAHEELTCRLESLSHEMRKID